MSWGVVQTRWGQERLANEFITRLGFESLIITYQRRIRGWKVCPATGRRTRSRTDGVQRVPLIRGYLFVLVDGLGEMIDHQPGVMRLMRHAPVDSSIGRPKLVETSIIFQIREAADCGLFDEIQVDSPIVVSIDDRVRTTSGIVGRLIGLDERGRAEVMTEILGGGVIRGLDARNLEKLAS